MKVLPTNNQQISYSFKGLWGSSRSETSGYHHGACIVKTMEYHPFANESNESVQKVINSETKSTWKSLYEKIVLYKSVVYIREKLPFTQEEFDLYKYLKEKNSKELCTKVEGALVEAKLYKYLNNRFKYFLRTYFSSIKKMIF